MRRLGHLASASTCLLGLALFASGCVVGDAQGYVERDERRFSVSGVPEVRIATFDGSIEVRAWDRAEVLVEIEKRGATKEAVGALEVVADQSGDRVQVEVRRPSRESLVGFGFLRSSSARLIVSLPGRSNLLARSGDGSIRIEDVSGQLELRTGDGSIRGAQLRGETIAHTGDGSVTFQDVEGSVEVTTGDGGVSVSGLLEQVQVRTGDGSVTVRAEAGSQMTGDWAIRTGDGGVALYLPSDFDATLDAHTGDGRIVSDLEIAAAGSVSDRRTLRGRLGAGGSALVVRSGDGSIRLRAS